MCRNPANVPISCKLATPCIYKLCSGEIDGLVDLDDKTGFVAHGSVDGASNRLREGRTIALHPHPRVHRVHNRVSLL